MEIKNDFWQTHSLKFLEMAFRSDRQETVHQADGHGIKTGSCGDTVEFFIILDQDRIKHISYNVNGCLNTNACANAVIELAQGKSLDQAWELKPEKVADYLESLSNDHFHCAELAMGAFYLALSDACNTRNASWKKIYR